MNICFSKDELDFFSTQIKPEDLKQIIKDAVDKIKPNAVIKGVEIQMDGVSVRLEDGDTIEIEIDWNEFVIKP